jgi:hypothetical protein
MFDADIKFDENKVKIMDIEPSISSDHKAQK